jgi:class 3 adenylate cyclase
MCRNVDARPALGLIQAPTLVLHAQEARFISIEHGRYLAEHIEGARLAELPGASVGIMDPIVSDEVEAFLTGTRPTGNPDRVLTTVLFSDIVGSTDRAAAVGDRRWETILNAHDRAVRDELVRYQGREIKTTGDGFVASFDRPTKAIRCAQAIVDATSALGIGVRTGLHTGECELRGDDIGGLAVHIAARIGALADAGEVIVSSTVKDLVIGSGIEFADRGERDLKGVPGTWKLFAVRG